MKLFNSEKDILLRILNLIFLIWFIVALIVLYNGVVNYLLKDNIESFSIYREKNCLVEFCEEDGTTVCSINSEKTEEDIKCENQYKLYEKEILRNQNQYLRQILSSILIMLTVSSTIIYTNKKKVS